jgi:hypothetical protein
MGTPKQIDHDLFRVLIYRNDATELLLEATPDRFRLPAVSVPIQSRVAEQVTAAIKGCWNLETCCLFTLPATTPHDASRYVLLEACRNEPTPSGMQWLAVAWCSVASFEDPADLAVIENSLTTLDQYRRGQLPGAFGKPGWLRAVMEWVETQASAAGLCLTGKFRQLNASPTFSLIRFNTDGPALWFKAVGEPNVHEHSITLKLASLLSDFLPRMLASRPEWNAWLTLESEGSPLDANSPRTAWAAAVENLALLQISSFGRRFELIDSGCRDLRPCRLTELVDPFLDAMGELMELQTKAAPAPLSRQELASLGRDLTASLKDLDECVIPNTLGHLDLNSGNLLLSGTSCVFLDWAEGYVGPPFFSFQYLLENLRRLRAADSHHEGLLVSAYVKNWTRFSSPSEIAAAFRLIPLLAAFTYAAGSPSWRNRENIRTETAGHLRSLARRMKREADALKERTFTCVP